MGLNTKTNMEYRRSPLSLDIVRFEKKLMFSRCMRNGRMDTKAKGEKSFEVQVSKKSRTEAHLHAAGTV
jgi:hypothetical protein